MIKLLLQYKIAGSFILISLIVGSYFIFKGDGSAETRYVLAAVERGTIITSITGSGQVSALRQVDVKPKVSGTVTYIGIKAGQQVYKGQALAYLDAKDALKSVRDAEISIESAQITLEKLMRNQQVGSETTAENLEQSYKDAYNKVSDAFLDLPNLIETARSVLYDNNIRSDGCYPNVCEYGNLAGLDFRFEFEQLTNRAEEDYKSAKDAFDPNFQTYRGIRLDASPEEIIDILKTTEKTTELLAQAIKSEQNMLDALVNNMTSNQWNKAQIPQQIISYQNSIGGALSRLNSILSNLGNARRSIESAKRSLEDAHLTNPVDLKSQENTVAQRRASLQDAQENLANYTIRSPFAGMIAKTDIEVGDSVSSSTAVAILLSPHQVLEIPLNEIDIANVELGQKATIIFDAVENLIITGEVLEIDSLGNVSQGVVTYDVVIGFDTQDERIKPGMTATASIITDVKQNVLTIPNSAVKFAGGENYVEIPGESNDSSLLANIGNNAGIALKSPLRHQAVEIGAANDSVTEVINGLQEGDIIISRTVSPTATQTSTQNNSLFPVGGRTTGGGAGGGFRR